MPDRLDRGGAAASGGGIAYIQLAFGCRNSPQEAGRVREPRPGNLVKGFLLGGKAIWRAA